MDSRALDDYNRALALGPPPDAKACLCQYMSAVSARLEAATQAASEELLASLAFASAASGKHRKKAPKKKRKARRPNARRGPSGGADDGACQVSTGGTAAPHEADGASARGPSSAPPPPSNKGGEKADLNAGDDMVGDSSDWTPVLCKARKYADKLIKRSSRHGDASRAAPDAGTPPSEQSVSVGPPGAGTFAEGQSKPLTQHFVGKVVNRIFGNVGAPAATAEPPSTEVVSLTTEGPGSARFRTVATQTAGSGLESPKPADEDARGLNRIRDLEVTVQVSGCPLGARSGNGTYTGAAKHASVRPSAPCERSPEF